MALVFGPRLLMLHVTVPPASMHPGGVLEINNTPTGNESVTKVFVEVLGPLFVTVIV